MKNIIVTVIGVFCIVVISCVLEIEAPHSNPNDPLYDGGDTTPPVVIDINTLDAYYNAAGGVAVSWGTPEESVMLLRASSAITDDEATAIIDGTEYSAGQTIGDLKVVYTGNGTTYLDTVFFNDGTYHYRLFSYDQSFNYSAGGVGASTLVYLDAIYVHYNGSVSNNGTSGSPLREIQDAINKAGIVGINQIRVAGDSTETGKYGSVFMQDGISISGGYNPVDWSDSPAPLSWPSIIERIGNDTGEFVTVSATDLSGTEVLSGFKIRNFTDLDSQNTAALYIDNSDITVQYCDIMGGDGATGESRGIYIKDASPTITDNYSIHGGAGGDSIGIIVSGTLTDPSNPTIKDNNFSGSCITGGGAATSGKSVGIEYRAYSGGSLEGNKITAAVNATSQDTFGIYVTGTGTAPIIHSNIIRGELTADVVNNKSIGVSLLNCPETVEIFNNVIFSENIRFACAVKINTSDVLLRNNTMYCSSTNGTSWVVHVEAVDAQTDITIQNNIIKASAGTGVEQSPNLTGISTYLIQRNHIADADMIAYYDAPSMQNWLSVAEMDANITGCSDNEAASSFGITADGRADTTSVEYEPFASAGFDGAGASPVWRFTTDFDGVIRTGNGTTGWSIGAYEYDIP